ncbi:hypothetical protein ACF0H5_020898 [Mactra antiquata]
MLKCGPSTIVTVLVISATRSNGNELCSTDVGYDFFIHDIMENTPIDSVLGHVGIHGTDDEIYFSQEANEFFFFDPSTRNVTLKKILNTDRGVPDIPELIINCNKYNESTGSYQIHVWVLVTDWNDNAPEFEYVSHTTSISEDALEGTIVYSDMVATDNDKQYDGNSRVLYRIVPNEEYSEYFEIQVPTVPSITLTQTLDYEQVQEMKILIEARDSPSPGRGPQRSSTATLIVHILDADDLNPVFSSKTYRGTISQGAGPGTIVVTSPKVEAYDPDTMNATVTYKLLDPYEFFTINPHTAEIRNVKTFDVDVPTLTVVVLASQVDNPNREWFAMLTISISEANINAPSFTKTLYEVTRTELEPVGSVLVTVTATDPDFGTFLVYDIETEFQDLTIDDSGNIILLSPLDYEREQEREINVTATDGSHVAKTTVKINVLDVNDNNPYFVFPLENEFLAEVETDHLITTIVAYDEDINDVLTFDLTNNKDLFTLTQGGELKVKDAEKLRLRNRNYYALQIVVSDDGKPARQASKLIEVVFPDLIITAPPTRVTKPSISTGSNRPDSTSTKTAETTTTTAPVAAASVAPADNMLTIILGAVAGVLLVVIIILVVYMCWRNKRTKEEIDRARAPHGHSAKGLTYRQAEAPDDLPKMDLRFSDDTDGVSDYDVGATTVQQNPLRKQGVNEAYMQSSGSEMDRDVSEIEIETAVVPYDDDYGYPSGRPDFDGQFRTFRGDDTTSNESNHSDSTGGSQRVLVNANKTDGSKMTSWDSDDKIHPQGAQKLLDSKDTTASRTKKERPEITVYF